MLFNGTFKGERMKQKPKPDRRGICGEKTTGKLTGGPAHAGINFADDPNLPVILVHTGRGKHLPGGRVK